MKFKDFLLIKQEKTRYHKERISRFSIGFDIGVMKMHDVDSSAVPITESLTKIHLNQLNQRYQPLSTQ